MLYGLGLGFLALELLYGTRFIYQSISGVYYVIKGGTMFIYRTLSPEKKEELKKEKYKMIQHEDLDIELKNKLVDICGDDFVILSQKKD